MHTIEIMTELQTEKEIQAYQRVQREIRNRDLRRGMRYFQTAEQFFSALHGLDGLGTKEREAARTFKLFQTPA